MRTTTWLAFILLITCILQGCGGEAPHDDHEGHDHGSDDETHAEDRHSEEPELHDEHLDPHGAEPDANHDDETALRLSGEEMKRFGIETAVAGPGKLENRLSLPGQIVFNEDRVVHMVPRVSGIALEVRKSIGDEVKAGDVLAIIESRELADAKSEYLAAEARSSLALKVFDREKKLREKGISSEQDFLEAEQSLTEANITLRSSEQKLHALGLTEELISSLDQEHDLSITRYEIRAPITGVITEKHLSKGESIGSDAAIFTVADVSSVWVHLTVYTKHLGKVAKGQTVSLKMESNDIQAQGKISMITPFVDEATRAATARVVLDNSSGLIVPGTFVTGFIKSSEREINIVIPKDAVQLIDGETVVFTEHDGAFEATPVTVGRSDREQVEITAGLEKGVSYVTNGAFELKANLVTNDLDPHAGHGH